MNQFRGIASIALCAFAIAAPTTAQLITWGPPLPTLAATDVNLNGTLVVARNLHAAGAAQSPTVAGVPFVGAFAPLGWNNASTAALAGSTTGDVGYDLLLNSARATSAAATANPTGWGAIRLDTLGTLTVGRNYEIQCWFTDQRLGAAALYDRVMTLSSAVGAATLVGGEVSNLGSLLQGPNSGPLDADPDNAPAVTTPDVLFGSHCTGSFSWVSSTDQLWLLVQGSHPTNNLRSHLTAFQVRELPTPTWSTYGSGCVGTNGTPDLQLVSLPSIGGTFAIDVTNLGTAPAFMLLGFTQLSIPLALVPQFAPGCTLLSSIEFSSPLNVVGGVASWTFALPASPAISGFQIHNQAIEFGALWTLSNGGLGTVR